MGPGIYVRIASIPLPSLCYGGVQGSAVQKFQTKINVYKIGHFTIKFLHTYQDYIEEDI